MTSKQTSASPSGAPGPLVTSGAPRRYGPDVGEPPPWFDPRRWGSLIGLAGGLVFITSYAPAWGSVVALVAWVVGAALALTALVRHYVRPVALGPLARPRPLALVGYVVCVLGELALIAVGTRLLVGAGRGELRPALIALAVGLHFLPFAWAFGERMFFGLGGAVAALGALGLATGAAGVRNAAPTAAVVAGLVLLVVMTAYADGRFAPGRRELGWAGRGQSLSNHGSSRA